jgi:hypothetical protein
MPFVADLLHARLPRVMLLDRNYVDNRECRVMDDEAKSLHVAKRRELPERLSQLWGRTSLMVVWEHQLSEGASAGCRMHRCAPDVYSTPLQYPQVSRRGG